MTDLNAVLKFSLGVDRLSFEMDGQHIRLDHGLSFIQSNSMRHGANSNMRCDSFKSLMIINKLSKFL